MAYIVAKRLVRHLERAGYVVMKRLPLGGHSAIGRGFEGQRRLYARLHARHSRTGKGHDHQAACGPSRLAAYAVRLWAFAHWRSCRWRARERAGLPRA
jgi:hypothetical protein